VKYSKTLGAVCTALFAFICAGGIAAQNVVSHGTSTTAYVYVSSNNNNTSQISAYAATLTGYLIPVPGSPFTTSGVRYMALNNHWLFGTDMVNIYSFSIASNGAIAQVGSVNAQQYNNPAGSGGPVTLFLDHTGATLYDGDIYGYQGTNTYQYWTVDQQNGSLTFLGLNPSASIQFDQPLSFIGNNQYAYGANCYHFNSPDIFGFQRASNGTLTLLDINPPIPPAPEGEYCPFFAAADPTNNLAISMFPAVDGTQAGPPQIADYAADSDGNLTTQSTANNMPVTSVSSVNTLAMAPSGQLLAVGGSAGLQVLHWNGANQATLDTPLLTSDNITQAFWDDAGHLYAVSPSANHLHVFMVTPTRYSEAPGSPYTISGVENLIVLPK